MLINFRSKLESLGWEPMWGLEDGLERTVDYYLED
jgi:nucleoside-diphosphate-sugar epimerase